jgi:hypothetical protein
MGVVKAPVCNPLCLLMLLFGINELPHFQDENPLANLEKKYGPATPLYWKTVINGWQWISRVWFESKDRIIIHAHNRGELWDIVTYVDSTVYTPAAMQLAQERTKETEKLFKRLD